MPTSLMGLFAEIDRAITDSGTYGTQIPGFPHHRLARSAEGFVAVYVATADNALGRWPVAVELEHLRVQYGLRCSLEDIAGGTAQDLFTVITCVSRRSDLQLLFLRVVSALLPRLGDRPTAGEISEAVSALVSLFRTMAAPPTKTVQGLWAELYLIVQATDPLALASAWHTMPADRYDFARGAERIEVKSTSRRVREHFFSLEQLSPPDATRLLIASVFVEPSAGGTSLGELMEEVAETCGGPSELVLRIASVARATLGQSFESALARRFDRELAHDSLRFFEGVDVPRPIISEPDRISQVTFRASLAQCQAWSRAATDDILLNAL